MKLFDVLDILEWAEENFGSLHTNRRLTRRDVMRAVKLGYAKSVGMGPPCDDDGFVLHDRAEREGFTLTEAGRFALVAFRRNRPEWSGGTLEGADR